MITVNNLTRLSAHEWEIPQTFRPDMRVPVRIFATRQLLEHIASDRSLEQAVNAASLPGLLGHVVVMPDMHQGYGFPIGAVAATAYPSGVISPGGIGYDINCGVRMLTCPIPAEAALPYMPTLATLLNTYCPSGVGRSGSLQLSSKDMDHLLVGGSNWALNIGYANKTDLLRTEAGGCLEGANPAKVSPRALERGRSQLGSLGAGNHFIEVDRIDEIFDEATAAAFGLQPDCLAVQIHCGSRGLGHQVCTDFVQEFQGVARRYGISLPDRELVCAPLDSPEGLAYLGAMRAAANFAFANRQLLAQACRRAFEETFAGKLNGWQLVQVYDVCHNIAKIETHTVDGKLYKVCVHRKGATRAFGPGAPGLPMEYKHSGQPVLVPGSMGTASWVLAGTELSLLRSWGSSCHGAGRRMSRSQARHALTGESLRRELELTGITVRAGSLPGLAEEAPSAYKDVDAVVETVVAAKIARKVARLRPMAVVKG